jgi:Ni,Fe-hydrogenase III small subunit
MSKWVLKGFKTGIKTTRYPQSAETAPGVSPGRPDGAKDRRQGELITCPTQAISIAGGNVIVDYRRCVHCFRCTRGARFPLGWRGGYEWGASVDENSDADHKLGKSFSHSIHIRIVDAGSCNACISELKQLTKPYYNMHRLGFFITPTPRKADILLVIGPVTDNMRLALQKTYNAMPTPKKVVAVGTCAISGGVFGPSFTCGKGVSDVLTASVEIPGCPPPPLAIMHGLLVAIGRAESTIRRSRW